MYFKSDFGSNRLLLCLGLLRGYWKKSLNPFYLGDMQSDRNFQVIKVALQVLGWVINIPKIVDITSVFSLRDFFNSSLWVAIQRALIIAFFFLAQGCFVHKEEIASIEVCSAIWGAQDISVHLQLMVWKGVGLPQVVVLPEVPHPALGVSAAEPCSQCSVALFMSSGYICVHDLWLYSCRLTKHQLLCLSDSLHFTLQSETMKISLS